MLTFLQKVISVIGLIAGIVLIVLLFEPFKNAYLNLAQPVGGDYYNGLSYSIQLSKHLPFPPSGWLNFWHEGQPIIGGYHIFPFYLAILLFNNSGPAVALGLYSVGALLLFLIFSLLLFWQITRSPPISVILTFILFNTRATHYQLLAEGLVAASSTQWFLPATLFLFYLFFNKFNSKYLIAASITTGLSILLHPGVGIIMVLVPSITLLICYLWQAQIPKRKKIFYLSVYSLNSFLLGIVSIYSLFSQAISGISGGGICNSPQCWGVYPQHLSLWLTILTPLTFIVLFSLAIATKLIKREKVTIKPVLFSLLTFLVLSFYLLAAYFHKIDSVSAIIFPRRLFWALNLLILVVAANSYRILTEALTKKLSWGLSLFFLCMIIFVIQYRPSILNFDVKSATSLPNTIPADITGELSGFVPGWVIKTAQQETNYRFDSLNQQVNHWWNTVFPMPATRGYSNFPIGENASWLYYLQVGTAENKPDTNKEIIRNRTLFLLDHYAISLYEDSQRSSSFANLGYDLTILNNPKIVTKKEQIRELSFYEISKDVVTPIVYATKTKPVYIVGDNPGYQTVTKVLSFTPLTSQKLIPVKGPENIDSLSSSELSYFPILILYQFKGNKWDVIKSYIENGGIVFIESALIDERTKNKLPDFFPVTSLRLVQTSKWLYEGNPWKIYASSKDQLKPEARVLQQEDDLIVLSSSQIGKGTIIVSGLNLPFHIVEFDNLEEAKMFVSFFGDLAETKVLATVTRNTPEKITVSGNDLRGVYFKENYHSGWKAKVFDKKVPVYKAGLSFMYIPIPREYQHQPEVHIQFQGNIVTWGLFFLSIIIFVGSLFSLITYWHFRLCKRLIQNKLLTPLKTWLQTE